MAEQIKFGDKLFLKGETLIIDNGASDAIIMSKNGTLRIEGDLTVQGVTTTVLSETVNIQDNQILLNSNFTGPNPTEDAGIEIERGDETNSHFLWQEASSRWTTGAHGLHSGSTISATTFSGNLTGSVTGDITSTGISTFTSVDINGGNIDGTVIGATNPQAGTFTNLNATTINGAVTGTVSNISNHDTDDLAEGTNNLYYTQARVDARYAQLQADANFIETLDGQAGSYYLDYTNFTNTPTTIAGYGITDGLSDVDVISVAPTTGQTVIWNGATWAPGDSFSQADFDSAFTAKDTDDLSEGSTNLYYTDARVGSVFDTRLATKFTDDLAEGSTNLYYTDARADARAQLKIDSLVDSAPGTLDTLNELAAALGDDANFSTTITTSLAGKEPTITAGTTSQYWRGDKSFQTLDTLAVAENTNLYYTDARAQAVSINNIVEDTTPQLGGNLDLNTYDLSTTDPTVSLTTTTTAVTTQGTVGASTESNLSNATVTVNDDGDYANAVSSYVTLTSTEIDNLGFKGESSLTYFGSAATTSNFVFRDASDNFEQNNMITTYSPPTDTYTFTLPTDASTPVNSADADINFKQYAYGEMTVTSSAVLSGSTIQLRDSSGFYIDKEHVEVSSLGGTSYKIIFWSQDVSVGDVIDVIASSAQTALFEWGTSSYSETGLVATAESFSLQSSTNDIFAMGDLEITTGTTTGEVVGTLIYDSPTNNTIVSGLTTVTIDGTGYQSALTVTEVPIIMTGNADTSNELSIAVGSATDARLWLLNSSGDLIYKFPAADGTANQVMKTDGSGDISWATQNTDYVTEGSNLYYTDARADARAQLKIDSLVDSAPGTLDTLNELADALGDDANFSTTMTNSLATKLAIADFNSTFDTRLGTKTTSDLTEGTNLYYTDTRARASINATGSLSYNSSTGVISYTQGNTDTVTEGSSNLYYTDARALAATDGEIVKFANMFATEGDLPSASTYHGMFAHVHGTGKGYFAHGGNWIKLIDETSSTTTDLTEGANLYHTTARARASISATGSLSYDSATGVISYTQGNTDTVAEGSTNLYFTDARARSSISVGGDLSYNSTTGVISFSESASPVTSVNTQTGAIVLDTDDITEGSNLYYTDARARAVSIENIVEDTTPQLGGNLDLNTYDLTTTDPTVTLTTTTTPVTTQGTVSASSDTNLSNTTVTVNDDGDYANAVSSYVTLTSTQIDTLGFKGDISLTYFGEASSSSNFVFRDTGDSIDQNQMITTYAPPTDTYTFTLSAQHADTDSGTPGNQNPLNISSADTDIKFKQSAYGEMTVTSSTVLSGSTIQLRDADGFYIDKEHVEVTSLGGTSYKITFWTHEVNVGDVIDVIGTSAQTAIFEWGTSTFSETGLVATAESFSVSSSTNDIFAMGDLNFTTGSTTGEVVGTLVYDSPTNNTIISGLSSVSIDGTTYQSAITNTQVPIIMTGNSGTSNELSLTVGSGTDARLWLLDSSANLIYKFPAADGTANQVMKTDGSGDISWATQSTDYVTEGSNLYYTDARADARAQLKIDALVGGASSAFDTLLEIENAMATDTELTNAISALNHDSLSGFVANEHIDWTSASAGTIHASNYNNTGDTTYTAGSGLSLVGTEFSNSAPDQTVSLTGAGATTVSGTYPNFTITSTDTNTTTDITGTIIPATDNTYDLGSTSKKYANIYGHTVEATYADLAERYASDAIYEAGTVVVFGGEAEITTTQLAGDVSVAGVISTNPALKLNAEAGNSQTHPYVALRGRVPCQIIGPVSKGDLIITAHDEPGYAKSNGKFDAGRSVFAKSIETDLSEGKKVIEVVIL